MRARKPTNLDKTLERFAAPIVHDPAVHQGRWAELFCCTQPGNVAVAQLEDASGPAPSAAAQPEDASGPAPSAAAQPPREIRLDLGCGKGEFLTAAALAEPDVLFIGLDNNETCIARSAQKTVEGGIPNIRLICADAFDIPQFFSPGELARIYLNFNSPFPKKKYARLRLAHAEHLLAYRPLVGEDGMVDFRTDNLCYWRWSLTQFELAGYTIDRQTDDLYAEARTIIASEYDKRTTARGATVFALQAHPGPAPDPLPDTANQTASMSLVDYLPDDLEELEHIPYGMEDTITNMRGRKANAEARAARHANR